MEASKFSREELDAIKGGAGETGGGGTGGLTGGIGGGYLAAAASR